MDTRPSPELLAPAGGPEPFRAALAGGADAIYCGFGALNARRSAENFDDESFAAACREAHLAGARVYVTLNVVIQEREMSEALELARKAASLGADALIVQDWGLMRALSRELPEIEVHVSTQANVHDARGVIWCAERFGASRVTLSRELSLPEIEACCATGIPCEAFAHGAICFCYSGLCLMSSNFGGRSANRGLCAQPCRLPFELVDEQGRAFDLGDRERLLCPKDMNLSSELAGLADAGVASLKIEGRMKAPDYVHAVVRSYREALDALDDDGDGGAGDDATERDRRLKRAFNRDFTSAYLHGRSGDEMMSYERSNNRGQLVGEVVASEELPDRVSFKQRSEGHGRKRFHSQARITIRLDEPVGKRDLLEVRPLSDPSQFFTCAVESDAAAGDVIECTGVRTADAGSPVRVIRSQAALDEVHAALSREHVRKRAVRVSVRALLGEPLEVSLETADGLARAVSTGDAVEPARTRAVSEDDLIEHVGRMGSTPFEPVSFDVELDEGVGLSFSALHHLRAEACSALEEAILSAPRRQGEARALGTPSSAFDRVAAATSDGEGAFEPEPEVCALVTTPDAARAALDAGATRIYVAADDLDAWPEDTWSVPCVPVLDELCRLPDHARLDAHVRAGAPLAVGNVSELALAAERGVHAEVRSCVPVHNVEAIRALEEAGACGIWLSPELTIDEISQIAPHAQAHMGAMVSGRVRVMTSEHCVLQSAGECTGACEACSLRARKLALRNIDGHILPVRGDVHGRSRIYAARSLDLAPEMDALLEAGVSRFLVDATLLDDSQVGPEVARIAAALEAARAGGPMPKRVSGATSGHLHQGIG